MAKTDEEILRRCYSARYLQSLNPPNAGRTIDYNRIRREEAPSEKLEMDIAIHQNTMALIESAKVVAQQVDGLILAQAIAAEKIAAFSSFAGVEGYQDEARKIVARVMAVQELQTGRVVPGIPFRSNKSIKDCLSVKIHVQKLATVLLANVAWSKTTFPFTVRDIILHPKYVASVKWGRSTQDP